MCGSLLQPLLIVVEENETVLNDTPEMLGLENVVLFFEPSPECILSVILVRLLIEEDLTIYISCSF